MAVDEVYEDDLVRATFQVQSRGGSSEQLALVGWFATDVNGNAHDWPADGEVLLSAGGTYVYSQSRRFPAGTYVTLPAYQRQDGTWIQGEPQALLVRAGQRPQDILPQTPAPEPVYTILPYPLPSDDGTSVGLMPGVPDVAPRPAEGSLWLPMYGQLPGNLYIWRGGVMRRIVDEAALARLGLPADASWALGQAQTIEGSMFGSYPRGPDI